MNQKKEEDTTLTNFIPKVSESLAGRMSSRKLFVWTTATVAFFLGKLDADYWAMVSLAYISVQSVLDFYKAKLGR